MLQSVSTDTRSFKENILQAAIQQMSIKGHSDLSLDSLSSPLISGRNANLESSLENSPLSSSQSFNSSPLKGMNNVLEKAKEKKKFSQIEPEQFMKLTSLSLSYFCQGMTNARVMKALEFLFSLKNLQSLSLNFQINELTSLQLDKIHYYCDNLTFLKLDFGSNNFGQENGLKSLENGLKKLKSLKTLLLDFRWNNIDDQSCQLIANALSNATQLEDFGLYLGNNKITSRGIQVICNETKDFVQLRKYVLHIYSNQINDDGAISIAHSLEHLVHLREIDINFQANNVADKGSIELCKAVSNLENLQEINLYLYMNQIRDYGILYSSKQFILSPHFGKVNKFCLEFNLKYRLQSPSQVYLICENLIKEIRLENYQHVNYLACYKKYIEPSLHYLPELQHWDLLY